MRNTKNMIKKFFLTAAFCVMVTMLTFVPTKSGSFGSVSVLAATTSVSTKTGGQLRTGGSLSVKVTGTGKIKSVKVSASNDKVKVTSAKVNDKNKNNATVKVKGVSKGSATLTIKVNYKDGSSVTKQVSLQVYDLSKWNSVFKQLKKLGYTKNQALGIMANLMWETGPVSSGNYSSFTLSTLANGFINPTASNGRYYGIFQFADGRKSNLMSWCKKHDLSPKKVSSQLRFMDYELHNSERSAYNKLKNTESAYSAAYSFAANYERCGYAYSMRGETAKRLDLFY